MQMKMTTRFLSSILLLTLVGLQLLGCTPASQPPETDPTEDFTVNMDMNTDFAVPDSLPDGGGQKVKVILLLGQSNASGASINAYLEKAVGKEQYARYEAGFDSVQINYCVDDRNATSVGSFVKVDMTCGANDVFFGPEVGMAEVLSEAYPDETVFKITFADGARHYLHAGGSAYVSKKGRFSEREEATWLNGYDALVEKYKHDLPPNSSYQQEE